LAGGIAHDFNNFLTGIIGNVSLAKLEVKPSAEIYPRLDDMEKAALRATTLTQQLLTFSKGGEPVKKLTEIATLVKESAKFALRGSNVSCKFDFQSNLAFCSVDEGQISQVIHNIVLNADQAMPDGGIIFISGALVDLAAENELSLAPGEYVLLTVEDQGQGIKKELIDKIFDPYFSTKKKGMGLGLAVAHSIIVKHKGRINVDSVPGRGTRFDIYLPVTSKAESLDQPARRALKNGEGKILVMDDELFIRELVAEMLKAAGYQVALATDGQDAVQLYQTAMQSGQAFDAVVLDLTIPGAMGGKRTVCKLKEIDPMVKAIVSSGYSHDPVMSDFKSYGFQGAVKKPYKVKELCAVLDRVLNNT
jgi:CheY-like chemotaxis protein